MTRLSPEQIADGLALWQEAKPHTAEDWQAIARRCVLSDYDPSNASPLFGALYWTTVALVALEQSTERKPG